MKTKILFLCTGNSCRSQMAEGLARHLRGDYLKVWSAGIEKHGLNPLAVQVMAEKNINISNHSSQLISELDEKNFDYVITVCSNAHESCPVFSGKAKIIHKGFDDPPRLAKKLGKEAGLQCYRRVCNEIEAYVQQLPDILD
jgi:arsenate reductase